MEIGIYLLWFSAFAFIAVNGILEIIKVTDEGMSGMAIYRLTESKNIKRICLIAPIVAIIQTVPLTPISIILTIGIILLIARYLSGLITVIFMFRIFSIFPIPSRFAGRINACLINTLFFAVLTLVVGSITIHLQ